MFPALAGLTPPPFWWLLGLACLGQGAWGARLAVVRVRTGRTALSADGAWFWSFAAGAFCGLVYGWVQHDAVFVLGQGCALTLGLLWRRSANKDGDG